MLIAFSHGSIINGKQLTKAVWSIQYLKSSVKYYFQLYKNLIQDTSNNSFLGNRNSQKPEVQRTNDLKTL